MAREPLETIKKYDPKLYERVFDAASFVYEEGALPARIKLLIAMALDAAHGAAAGVASLAQSAMQHGATREEIMETLRVAGYISGVGSVYTASAGLAGIFEQNAPKTV